MEIEFKAESGERYILSPSAKLHKAIIEHSIPDPVSEENRLSYLCFTLSVLPSDNVEHAAGDIQLSQVGFSVSVRAAIQSCLRPVTPSKRGKPAVVLSDDDIFRIERFIWTGEQLPIGASKGGPNESNAK